MPPFTFLTQTSWAELLIGWEIVVGQSQPWGRAHARRGWGKGAPHWPQPRHLSDCYPVRDCLAECLGALKGNPHGRVFRLLNPWGENSRWGSIRSL